MRNTRGLTVTRRRSRLRMALRMVHIVVVVAFDSGSLLGVCVHCDGEGELTAHNLQERRQRILESGVG